MTGNYTYDDSRVLVSPNATDPALLPGNRLLRRPLNSGSLTISSGWKNVNVLLAGYFSGQRTDSDFLFLGLPPRTPGYARIDLSASYRMGRGFTPYVRVVNLLDKFYQDALGYPALGREARVGMNYRFGGKN